MSDQHAADAVTAAAALATATDVPRWLVASAAGLPQPAFAGTPPATEAHAEPDEIRHQQDHSNDQQIEQAVCHRADEAKDDRHDDEQEKQNHLNHPAPR